MPRVRFDGDERDDREPNEWYSSAPSRSRSVPGLGTNPTPYRSPHYESVVSNPFTGDIPALSRQDSWNQYGSRHVERQRPSARDIERGSSSVYVYDISRDRDEIEVGDTNTYVSITKPTSSVSRRESEYRTRSRSKAGTHVSSRTRRTRSSNHRRPSSRSRQRQRSRDRVRDDRPSSQSRYRSRSRSRSREREEPIIVRRRSSYRSRSRTRRDSGPRHDANPNLVDPDLVEYGGVVAEVPTSSSVRPGAVNYSHYEHVEVPAESAPIEVEIPSGSVPIEIDVGRPSSPSPVRRRPSGFRRTTFGSTYSPSHSRRRSSSSDSSSSSSSDRRRRSRSRDRTRGSRSRSSDSSASRDKYDDYSVDDSDIDSETFDLIDFALKSSDTVAGDDLGADSEKAILSADTAARHVPLFGSIITDLSIVDSTYKRGSTAGGKSSATGRLTMVKSGNEAYGKPLFRWIHYQHAQMNFDAYYAAVKEVKGLPARDRAVALEVLDTVRSQHVVEPEQHHTVIGRYLQPHCLDSLEGSAVSPSARNGQHVTSFCFSYFCLQDYPSVDADKRSVVHPPRPLLQSTQPSTKRSNDEQQAVNMLPNADKSRKSSKTQCFQVAQIWAVVVSDQLLLTCSSLPFEELQKEVIHEKFPTSDESSNRIELRHKEAELLWLLPKSECRSPLEFRCLFWKVQQGLRDSDLNLEFTTKGQTLRDENEQRIFLKDMDLEPHMKMNLAIKKSRSREDEYEALSLDMSQESSSDSGSDQGEDAKMKRRTSPADDDMRQHVKSPSSDIANERRSDNTRDRQDSKSDSSFHAFTWLGSNAQSSRGEMSVEGHTDTAGQQTLHIILEQVATYMTNFKDSPHVRRAYRSVTPRTWSELVSLKDLGSTRRPANEESEHRRSSRERNNRVVPAVIEMVETCVQVYLPLDTRSIVLHKLYGAIHAICERIQSKEGQLGRSSAPRESREKCREITKRARLVRRAFASGRPGLDVKGTLDEFIKSFISAVAGACLLATDSGKSRKLSQYLQTEAEKYLVAAPLLALKAAKLLFAELKTTQFTKYEAVLPMGVLGLITSRLTGDVTFGKLDIADTYWTYFKYLEGEVQGDAFTRRHQTKLSNLKAEINAVLFNLNQQRSLVIRLKDRIEQARLPSAIDSATKTTITPTSNWSTQDLVLDDSIDRLTRRINGFQELLAQTTELQTWNLSEVENNKSRQDAAIYAFTIVTIIFLPLSFVSSVLGMNTSDIANMEQTQWVFWVAGIGLTVIVVVLALIWAGEFGNAYREAVRLLQGRWGDYNTSRKSSQRLMSVAPNVDVVPMAYSTGARPFTSYVRSAPPPMPTIGLPEPYRPIYGDETDRDVEARLRRTRTRGYSGLSGRI